MKKSVPKRLCRDPQTQYCKGKYAHHGCCDCYMWNSGDLMSTRCEPYMLPEIEAELKLWWAENYPDQPWDEAARKFPKKRRRHVRPAL